MALELRDVSYTYGEGTPFALPAVSDVDLRVDVGTVTLVLGPTGSGKSTVLSLLAGLLQPTRGGVFLEDAQCDGLLAGTDAGVGIVFQAPESQLFAETVLEDVAFGPRNQGLDRSVAEERAREALTVVGLDPELFQARSPFTLSGGEARRVALAGVLAMRPRYLLLDEPTAGLDAAGRDALLAVLDSLRGDTGIVIVTHDAEEFLGRADAALVLCAGLSEYSGQAQALIEDPAPLERAGLTVPDVVAVMRAARADGLDVDANGLDPIAAACALIAALERRVG